MANYDFDINKASAELLPPDKRAVNNTTLIKSLLSGISWAYDWIFKDYYNGSDAPVYYFESTYNYLDKVRYDREVYLSLIDNNNSSPLVTTDWIKIQTNFLGVKSRVVIKPSKLILEYAINTYFGGTFRQPTSVDGTTDVHSDIYFTLLPSIPYGFVVGQTTGATVGKTTSSASVGFPYPFVYPNSFQINIPTALLNTLAATEAEQLAIIRNFVNPIKAAGSNFTILAY